MSKVSYNPTIRNASAQPNFQSQISHPPTVNFKHRTIKAPQQQQPQPQLSYQQQQYQSSSSSFKYTQPNPGSFISTSNSYKAAGTGTNNSHQTDYSNHTQKLRAQYQQQQPQSQIIPISNRPTSKINSSTANVTAATASSASNPWNTNVQSQQMQTSQSRTKNNHAGKPNLPGISSSTSPLPPINPASNAPTRFDRNNINQYDNHQSKNNSYFNNSSNSENAYSQLQRNYNQQQQQSNDTRFKAAAATVGSSSMSSQEKQPAGLYSTAATSSSSKYGSSTITNYEEERSRQASQKALENIPMTSSTPVAAASASRTVAFNQESAQKKQSAVVVVHQQSNERTESNSQQQQHQYLPSTSSNSSNSTALVAKQSNPIIYKSSNEQYKIIIQQRRQTATQALRNGAHMASLSINDQQQVQTIQATRASCNHTPYRNSFKSDDRNSALQCVMNTPVFNEFFFSGKLSINSKNKNVATSYAEVLKTVRSTGSSSSTAPSRLKRAIESVSRQFSGYDQQDAQELLRTVLDGLHEDLNRNTSKPKYQELTADLNKQTIEQISNDWYEYSKKIDDSIVSDFFSGQLINTLKCTVCSMRESSVSSVAFDNFMDLSLSFSRDQMSQTTIEKLLENFFKEERLDYKCPKCRKNTEHLRKFQIFRLPEILVIHFKRFNFGQYNRQKISSDVQFPVKDLSMRQFVHADSKHSSVQKTNYTLFGIVNHSGSLSGGHYTSESLCPYDGKWYNFNDSHASQISVDQIIRSSEMGRSSPYLLFYCKHDLLNYYKKSTEFKSRL